MIDWLPRDAMDHREGFLRRFGMIDEWYQALIGARFDGTKTDPKRPNWETLRRAVLLQFASRTPRWAFLENATTLRSLYPLCATSYSCDPQR